jgi:hypothetical protein
VPVEKADRDQQGDHQEDGAAERLDVEEDGEEHPPRLRPRYCDLGPAD